MHGRRYASPFFSPLPYFIGGFFFPHQLLQLAWLYRLWKLNPKRSEVESKELDQIVDYVPYYAVENLCIAGKSAVSLQQSPTLPKVIPT